MHCIKSILSPKTATNTSLRKPGTYNSVFYSSAMTVSLNKSARYSYCNIIMSLLFQPSIQLHLCTALLGQVYLPLLQPKDLSTQLASAHLAGSYVFCAKRTEL